MSIQVKIPTVLRKHTNGEAVLDASGTTIRELIDDVGSRFPEFKDQVVADDGNLHRFINVYANDEDVRYLNGLDTQVSDGDTVAILPAVAGGSAGRLQTHRSAGGSGGPLREALQTHRSAGGSGGPLREALQTHRSDRS